MSNVKKITGQGIPEKTNSNNIVYFKRSEFLNDLNIPSKKWHLFRSSHWLAIMASKFYDSFEYDKRFEYPKKFDWIAGRIKNIHDQNPYLSKSYFIKIVVKKLGYYSNIVSIKTNDIKTKEQIILDSKTKKVNQEIMSNKLTEKMEVLQALFSEESDKKEKFNILLSILHIRRMIKTVHTGIEKSHSLKDKSNKQKLVFDCQYYYDLIKSNKWTAAKSKLDSLRPKLSDVKFNRLKNMLINS